LIGHVLKRLTAIAHVAVGRISHRVRGVQPQGRRLHSAGGETAMLRAPFEVDLLGSHPGVPPITVPSTSAAFNRRAMPLVHEMP
jgi:hypothetical protein